MLVHEVGQREGLCGHTSYLYVCVSGSDWDTAKGSNAPNAATNRVCNLMPVYTVCRVYLDDISKKAVAVDSTCLPSDAWQPFVLIVPCRRQMAR